MKRWTGSFLFSLLVIFLFASNQAISSTASFQANQDTSSLGDSSEKWRFTFSLHLPALHLHGEVIEIIYLKPGYGEPMSGDMDLDFEQIPELAEVGKQWAGPLPMPPEPPLIVEVTKESDGKISASFDFIHQVTGHRITASLTGDIIDDTVTFSINYSLHVGLQNYSFHPDSTLIYNPQTYVELGGTVSYSLPANLTGKYVGNIVEKRIEGQFTANVTSQFASWLAHVKGYDDGALFYDGIGRLDFSNIRFHGNFTVDILPAGVEVIPPYEPPRLTVDLIHNGQTEVNIRSQAISLGYDVREISGNAIQESDLDGTDIVLIYTPCTAGKPDYALSEINLLVNFVQDGGALYIVPMYCNTNGTHNINVATSVNTLYDVFGFGLSGEHHVMEHPTKVVNSPNQIMTGVTRIQVIVDNASSTHPCPSVAVLSTLVSPCESIYADEGHPLFLIAGFGGGRVFVDLTSYGIGSRGVFDNLLVVRNALVWLKGTSTDVYRMAAGESLCDVSIETNSTLSFVTFDKSSGWVSFYATGLDGTTGFCNITILKSFMWCDNIDSWIVTVNGLPPSDIEKTEDTSNTYIYLIYHHSTHNIEIYAQQVVPEFPSFLILPLCITAVLLAALVWKSRKTKPHVRS